MHLHCIVLLLAGFGAVTNLADPTRNASVTISSLVAPSAISAPDLFFRGRLGRASTSLAVEEKSLESPSSLFSTLLTRLRKVLSKLNSKVSAKVEAAQRKRWLAIQKTPIEAFRELIAPDTHVFNSPMYPTWVRYVEAFQLKYPNHDMTEVGVIRTFVSDLNLLKMLASIDNVDTTVSKVVNQLVSIWMKERKNSEDVFNTVMSAFKDTNLGEAVDTPLETVFQIMLDQKESLNPLLDIWVEYLVQFSLQKALLVHRVPKTSIASDPTMVKAFEILALSDEGDNQRSISIVREFIEKWLSEQVPPKTIFRMFNFDRDFKKLLVTPLYRFYDNYNSCYQDRLGVNLVSIIRTMTVSYDDRTVASLLQGRKEWPTQLDQMKEWFGKVYNPDNVYEKLKLDLHDNPMSPKIQLQQDPIAKVWKDYYVFYKNNIAEEIKKTEVLKYNL